MCTPKLHAASHHTISLGQPDCWPNLLKVAYVCWVSWGQEVTCYRLIEYIASLGQSVYSRGFPSYISSKNLCVECANSYRIASVHPWWVTSEDDERQQHLCWSNTRHHHLLHTSHLTLHLCILYYIVASVVTLWECTISGFDYWTTGLEYWNGLLEHIFGWLNWFTGYKCSLRNCSLSQNGKNNKQ